MALSGKTFALLLIVAIAAAGVIEFQYAASHPHEGGEGSQGSAASATPTVQAYHVHADVSVVVNGQRLPFTDFRLYQNPVACDDEKPGATPVPGEVEAHFHSGNDHVAHFHAPGITWTQFWLARNVTMTNDCVSLPTSEHWCNNDYGNGDQWQMVLNGQLVGWNPNTVPNNLDRVLFTYSRPLTQTAAKLEFDAQVSNDACIYSGTCPERGTAPAESCGQPAA